MKMIECPICNTLINDTSRAKGLHAKKHKISSEDFYCLINKITYKTCDCGCKKRTKWSGWKFGFKSFVVGHMSKKSRVEGIKKLQITVQNQHWSRGKTKKDHPSLKKSGEKISKTLKRKYQSGEINHWAKGETALTHNSLAKRSISMKKKMSSSLHWNFDSIENIQEKICLSLLGNFQCEFQNIPQFSKRKNNRDKHFELTINCTRCGKVYKKTIYEIVRHRLCGLQCIRCDRNKSSKPQREITEFIKSLIKHSVYENDRSNPTGYELDIWIPEIGVAFEFNGLYWHSDAINSDKNYHNKKVIKAHEHSIQLMHIFEDEWRDKKEIIKSMIKIRLNIAEQKIHARKCNIVTITNNEAKKFMIENHLDGYTKSSKAIALKFNNKIVSVMTFRKPFSKKWKGWTEIARFASSQNIIVRGGYTKLLKFACYENKKILTYVDTRWGSTGNHCKTMKYIGKNQTFWWTDKQKRFNRLKCTATKKNSENDEAALKGLFKIYGCDVLVFVADAEVENFKSNKL